MAEDCISLPLEPKFKVPKQNAHFVVFFFLNHKIYKLQQTNKTQHTPQLFSHYFHGFTKGNIFPNHSISFLSKTLKGSAIFRPNLVHTRLWQGAAHL